MIVYFQVFARNLGSSQSYAVLEKEIVGKEVIYNILITFEQTSCDKGD